MPEDFVQFADHARVERAELSVEHGSTVVTHRVDGCLQVIWVHAEQGHSPLIIIDARGTGYQLKHTTSEVASGHAVFMHHLFARFKIEGEPVVDLTPPLRHRVEAEGSFS